MKKIAMINCLNAGEVCAGVSCLNAFNQKSAFFAGYGDKELCLTAFMRCNGCGRNVKEDAGLMEKMERIRNIAPDAIHFGVCTRDHSSGLECVTITEIAEWFEHNGLNVVRGTH